MKLRIVLVENFHNSKNLDISKKAQLQTAKQFADGGTSYVNKQKKNIRPAKIQIKPKNIPKEIPEAPLKKIRPNNLSNQRPRGKAITYDVIAIPKQLIPVKSGCKSFVPDHRIEAKIYELRGSLFITKLLMGNISISGGCILLLDST